MRIVVASIPDAGTAVEASITDPWVVQGIERGLGVEPTSATLSWRVTARGEEVLVAGTMRVEGSATCERCGEQVHLVLADDTELRYAPRAAAHATAEEVELDADDLDIGFYEGGALHLSDVVAEAVALALPARITCADTIGCEERTAALLATQGSEGPQGHPAFAILDKS